MNFSIKQILTFTFWMAVACIFLAVLRDQWVYEAQASRRLEDESEPAQVLKQFAALDDALARFTVEFGTPPTKDWEEIAACLRKVKGQSEFTSPLTASGLQLDSKEWLVFWLAYHPAYGENQNTFYDVMYDQRLDSDYDKYWECCTKDEMPFHLRDGKVMLQLPSGRLVSQSIYQEIMSLDAN